MYDNYHYPLGADTPSAPWNEKPIPEKDFIVCVSQTLSKSAEVTTDNYLPVVVHEKHNRIHEEYADTSDTKWKEVYKDNEHYTPLQLISLFRDMLEGELEKSENLLSDHTKGYYEHLIEECSNWIEDELEIIEE